MKTLLKIFAIICVLSLVVTCFAACGKKDVYGPANGPQSSNKGDKEDTPSSSDAEQGGNSTESTSSTDKTTSSGSESGSSQDSSNGSTTTPSTPDKDNGSSSELPVIDGDIGTFIPL